jgi:AraC-like DNA-binding protein
MPEIFFTNKHFSDLNPITTGRQKCEPLFSRGTKKANHCILHYVISGKGSLVLEGKFYKICANQAFIIYSGMRYFYQADEEDPWEYVWIDFDGIQTAQLANLKSPVINMDYKLFENLDLCKEYVGQEAEYLAGRLFLILVEITKKTYISNYVLMAKNYITTYYSQNIKIGEIADTIGLNRKYLAKIFKKSTGMTMSEFLFDVRMRTASGAISNGEKSITKISNMSGFEDPLFFSRQFKKYFGLSPREFMKNEKN